MKKDRLFPHLFCLVNRSMDRLCMTGNHNLTRAVKIGRRDHLPLRNLLTKLLNLVSIHAEDRRHRPLPHGYRFLHEPSPKPNDLNRIAEIESSGGNKGTVLSEAVAGGELWRDPVFCL